MKRISNKRIERLENKKRKIEKFLELIDNNNKNNQGDKKSDNCDEGEDQTDKEVESPNDQNITNVFDSNFKQMSELRKKLSMKLTTERPKIFVDNKYLITEEIGESLPECLSLEDIQNLILATLLPPPRLSNPPNWCKVYKPTKATKVSVFAFDYDLTENSFNENQFKYCVKFESTDDWVNHLMNVRLSNRQLEKMHKQYKSNLDSILEPIEIPSEERVSRTELLLSALQMTIEKYPMPTDPNYGHFAKTKSKYCQVSDSSPIFSIDCEMCYTTADKLEVTRISVVDENCDLVYDTLVKPKNKITNYLTKFSGITKKLLDPIEVTLEDVHKELNRILPEDAILCGQSLNSDLQALQLIHPYIIDTSVIYNLSGFRPVKPSLKTLAQRFLNMSIQNNDMTGHCSTEDAIAAMKLVKLKLSMGLEFGDRVLNKKALIFDALKQSMSITSYLERLNTQFDVYYDYVDIESSEKSMFIYTKHSFDLFDAINRVIHTDKAVCIVLHKNGKCFIKF